MAKADAWGRTSPRRGLPRSVEIPNGLASQSEQALGGRNLRAAKDFSQEYETVTVVTSDGTKLQGVVLNEDSFTVQMLDTREQLHAFEKNKLRSYVKTRESLMPAV